MKLLKFKRHIDIDKKIGNIHIWTFHYYSYVNGERKSWTELNCWYEEDCEHCPLYWEDRKYEGECYDYGCYMAECGNEYPKTFMICMLPDWIKKILLRRKGRK